MIRIGIDESGTGALAGPFTVGAVFGGEEFSKSPPSGLRDSKKLSDKARRALVPVIKTSVQAWVVVGVPSEVVAKNHRLSWVLGITSAVRHLCDALSETEREHVEVIMDGSPDRTLTQELEEMFEGRYEFIEKADSKFPEVMAASILAKTYRNDTMVALSQLFPQYGWAKNAGYGTVDHKRAMETHGLTVQHRPFRGDSIYKPFTGAAVSVPVPSHVYVAGSSYLAIPNEIER